MSLFRSSFQSGTYTPNPDTPAGSSTYEELVLGMSPDAYWPMDEASGNLVDASGNSWTATANGDPTYSQTGPTIDGDVQDAITLDGTGDYFDVGEGIDDGITSSDDFTISIWFKTTDTGDWYLFTKNNTNQKTWELYGDTGRVQAYTYQTDGATIHANTSFIGSNNLDDGTWHHVVMWQDSGTGLYLDVDGGTYTDSDTSLTGTWNAESDSGMVIGGSYAGFSLFTGSLCHCALWWSLLTSGQRSSLYTGT